MKHRKAKHDESKKCLKYIERNDLPRLKSYIKKYKIDLNEIRLDGDDTLLHAACRFGHDAIVSYLLRKGANCTKFNAEGDLPIHLAVKCALQGNEYAYTDLVLPLINRAPSSLDVANLKGQTCRQLLAPFKASVSTNLQDSDTESSSDDDQAADEEEIWQKRLADEMTSEYLEQCNRYDDGCHGDADASETWDQWADRIHQEHNMKNQATFCQPVQSSRKRYKERGKQQPKRPKISEERQKRFEENIRQQTQKEKEELAQISNLLHQKSLENYEYLCSCLFDDTRNERTKDHIFEGASVEKTKSLRRKLHVLENKAVLIEFQDIPWPVKNCAKLKRRGDFDESEVMEFLFRGLDTKCDAYKELLKKEQRKWHPDRFFQKCGARLKDADRNKITSVVTKISQVLNKLTSDAKQE